MNTRKHVDFNYFRLQYPDSVSMPSYVRLGWTIAIIKAAALLPPNKRISDSKLMMDYRVGDIAFMTPMVRSLSTSKEPKPDTRLNSANNGIAVSSLGRLLAEFWGLRRDHFLYLPANLETISRQAMIESILDHLFLEIDDLSPKLAASMRECLSCMMNAQPDQYYDWHIWLEMLEPLMLIQILHRIPEALHDFMYTLDGHLQPLKYLFRLAGGRLQLENPFYSARRMQEVVVEFDSFIQHDFIRYQIRNIKHDWAIFYVAHALSIELEGVTLADGLTLLSERVNSYLLAYTEIYGLKARLDVLTGRVEDEAFLHLIESTKEKAQSVYQSYYQHGVTLFGLTRSLACLMDDQQELAGDVAVVERLIR